MATKSVSHIKSFSNLEEVIDKMAALGFFNGSDNYRAQKLAELTDPNPSVHASNEFWYSNGYLEVKIFRGMFGSYELCNFRGIKHAQLEELFAVAEIPRIS